MNLAQALSAGRWTFPVEGTIALWSLSHDAEPVHLDLPPGGMLACLPPAKPTIRRRKPSIATPRYKNGRTSPVRDRLLAALKDGALTRGEIVRRMADMDSVAVDVLLCRLVQKGVIVRTKEPGCRAFYALAGEQG